MTQTARTALKAMKSKGYILSLTTVPGTPRSGRNAHSICWDAALSTLLMGTEDPEMIVEQEGIELSGDGEQLIKALFPPQFPQIAAVDI